MRLTKCDMLRQIFQSSFYHSLSLSFRCRRRSYAYYCFSCHPIYDNAVKIFVVSAPMGDLSPPMARPMFHPSNLLANCYCLLCLSMGVCVSPNSSILHSLGVTDNGSPRAAKLHRNHLYCKRLHLLLD